MADKPIMDKDILGSKIKNATDKNLIKLVVEHYLSKREKGKEEGGLLSNNELEMARQEANKRKIARKIDIILTADNSIAFTRFDLESSYLLMQIVYHQIANGLEELIKVADVFSIDPENESQTEYQSKVVQRIKPYGYSLKGLFGDFLPALDVQVKRAKKCIVAMYKIEEWADYPIIRGRVEDYIKDSRFAIQGHLGALSDKVNELYYSFGDRYRNVDDVVYRLAFYNLSDEDRTALKGLYGDADYDSSFLDEQEKLKELFDNNNKLIETGKEALATLIIGDKPYNKHLLYNYFANIPKAKIAHHYLVKRGARIEGYGQIEGEHKAKIEAIKERVGSDREREGIAELYRYATHTEPIQKALEAYAKEHHKEIFDIMRDGLYEWIGEGLFDEHPPLCICEKELFDRWLKAKAEMKKTIQGLIDKGELQTTDKGEIVGESLYRLTGHHELMDAISRLYNKGFRAYIEKEVGLDSFVETLDKINGLCEIHTKLTEEEEKQIQATIDHKLDMSKAPSSKTSQDSPYYNIPLENRGLTEKEHKEIEERVTYAKREYA